MSMFLDQVTIEVKAGKGGDGMVAFRREKYVPDGGPAGGDGGRGGDIIFVVDEGLRTLMDFRYNRIFKAQPGENGMGKGMHGRGATDRLVKVPAGTTVKDAETGKVLGDLIDNGQQLIVAHGGRADRVGGGHQECVNCLRFFVLVMRGNGIDDVGRFVVPFRNVRSDHRVGTFDLVVHRFADVVQKARAARHGFVQPQFGRKQAADVRDLQAVVKRVLSVTGAKTQLADQRCEFRVNVH